MGCGHAAYPQRDGTAAAQSARGGLRDGQHVGDRVHAHQESQMALPPGREACTRMKGATHLGRTSHEQGIPSHAFWTNSTQGKPEAWYASESRTCPASTVPRRDAMTS